MRSIPPIPTGQRLLGAIALAIALAGCGAPIRPTASSQVPSDPASNAASDGPSAGPAGLLVVANGRVRELGDDGALAPFAAPDEGIQAAVAAVGRVLVVGADGRTWVSEATRSSRFWTALPASVTTPGVAPLIALSPSGTSLAAVRGDPQAARFDLDLIDVPDGTARRAPVPRGLNGPPAWLAPTTVVVNVIPRGASSGLAAIDVATGAVRDDVGPGIEVAVSSDGGVVARLDSSGDVLVGEARQWRAGRVAALARLEDARTVPGSVAERVAISGDGQRVAIVRRGADDVAAVKVWLRDGGSWRSAALLDHLSAGPVSVAWTR
jgi:hypothetical protein